jgi:hypothetical protein
MTMPIGCFATVDRRFAVLSTDGPSSDILVAKEIVVGGDIRIAIRGTRPEQAIHRCQQHKGEGQPPPVDPRQEPVRDEIAQVESPPRLGGG